MITINVITVNSIEYLTGKIGRTGYSVVFSEEIRDEMVNLTKKYSECTTSAEATKVLEHAQALIDTVKSVSDNSLTEVLKNDLSYNAKTNSYHVISGGKVSVEPVHEFFCDKMIEANDKGLSPKPWLIFWVRLMRNHLYVNDSVKVQNLVNYLEAKYRDNEAAAKLVEDEGYSERVAQELSTFDQISITEEGILAAFKYVRLIDTKFVVTKDEKTGEQIIEEKAKYERTVEVDEVTGEITKDELDLPSTSEEFLFQPPMMGTGGSSFTSKEIGDTSAEPVLGHVCRVGRIHELPEGFKQVNTNDRDVAVKGLHLGGYYYVKNFGGQTSYLVDCLVAPEDIGAVCDVNRGDGAIRCKRYMITGGHFAVSQGMYHPSDYAQLLDAEWDKAKADVIAELNKQKDAVNAKL